jgi:hypothetical protein
MSRSLHTLPLAALLALVACATAPATDGTDTDTDAQTDACCVVQQSLLDDLADASTDPASFATACQEFDDSSTYPGIVGQELCTELMDGRWCEWTCD